MKSVSAAIIYLVVLAEVDFDLCCCSGLEMHFGRFARATELRALRNALGRWLSVLLRDRAHMGKPEVHL